MATAKGKISLPELATKLDAPAFCGVIQQPLVVSTCPLPRGACTWKHRGSGRCTYDPSISSDLSISDLALRVGEAVPSETEIVETREKLREAIKKSL